MPAPRHLQTHRTKPLYMKIGRRGEQRLVRFGDVCWQCERIVATSATWFTLELSAAASRPAVNYHQAGLP